MPTAQGLGLSCSGSFHGALCSPRAETLPPGKPYLPAPPPGPTCLETPSWRQPQLRVHLQPSEACGAAVQVQKVPGQPPPPCPREVSEDTELSSLCLLWPSVPGSLYLYFPFPGPGGLPLSCLRVSPLCPLASCPLRSCSSVPSEQGAWGSGLRRFLPGQRWMQPMSLLIFTVSPGDQPATPAAFPRHPTASQS